jgi:glycosyltransferase involved in cell wall biosynthesis
MSLPLISVCIPTYNNGAFIVETLQCITGQTYPNLEIIVVDDCSTDDTVAKIATVKDERIKVIQNTVNLGMHGNWQKALDLATGHYIKLVCGDDLLVSQCIEKQLAAFQAPENTDLVLVGCKRSIINSDGKTSFGSFYKLFPGKYTGARALKLCALFGTNLIGEPMTVLFKGEVFRENKIRLGSNNYMIDLDLHARLLKYGKLLMLGDTLASFRIYGDSMTGSLGMKRRSAFFREFISEKRLAEDFGITAFYRLAAYSSEFLVSRMRSLILRMSNKN